VLDARLRFVVKRLTLRPSPGGAIKAIAGNPGVAHVHVVLKPGAVFAASWRWRNWCGRRGTFQLQPSFGSAWPYLAVPTNAVRAPACTSASTRSTLTRVPVRVRRCAAGDLRLNTGIRGGFMQSLIAGTRITLSSRRRACLLVRAEVALAIQKRVGGSWTTLEQIAGNPARRALGALLAPKGEATEAFWAWRNWCGGSGSFRTLMHANGDATPGPVFTDTPVCADESSPSTLTPSFGHS
jgi:hypothetical protein